MQLRGILDTSLGGYLTFRGYAKLEDIANLSKADASYQRDLIDTHKEEIKDFLTSGKNLFFPEVILGCMLAEDDEVAKVSNIYDTLGSDDAFNENFKKLKLQSAKAMKFQVGEDIRSVNYFRSAIMTFQKSHQELILRHKPFTRIDGNHRISAAEEIDSEDIKKLNIPFSIVFFRNKIEASKYSRVIFHNINYKSIPLTMEQNLRLILDDEIHFSDDELKTNPSFGWEYYFARQMDKEIIDGHFPHIKGLLDDEFRTTFLKLFQLLLNNEKIYKNEDEITKVREALTEVNSIYSSQDLKRSKKATVFAAFMYYKIADTLKIQGFKKWVIKNQIFNINETSPNNIIDIYNHIADNKIKNIFVAMAFGELNCENVWDSICTVYNQLIDEDKLQLDITLLDTHEKPMPNRVDKDMTESQDIIKKIKEGIEKCDLFLGDLSYQKQNVYYEIGLAEAQNKPMILIHDETIAEDKIHFDVSTKDRLKYKATELPQFKTDLRELLKRVIEGRE